MLCGDCRQYGDGSCRHPLAYARFRPDGQSAKSCAAFASRYAARRGMMWAIPAPVWVASLLVLVLVGLAVSSWFIDPHGRYFRGNPLHVIAWVPDRVDVGQTFIITMRITNVLEETSSRIYLEIDDEFLQSAAPVMPLPEPRPARINRLNDRLVLEYPPLPAGGNLVVQLPFVPLRTGTAPFVARIYAPSNQLGPAIEKPIRVGELPTAIGQGSNAVRP
jgi:hypothetical protein